MKNIFDIFDDSVFFSDLRPATRQESQVKITENEEEHVIVMAVPGVNKDNIKIDIDNEMLTVSSSQKTEFSSSEFVRSWSLPAGAEIDGIKASCKDGILKISIPKAQQSKISIPIE